MKHCEKCDIDVRGAVSKCPLCQCHLEGEAETPVYPEIKSIFRQYALLFRIIILSSIAVGTVSVAVNLILPDTGFWSPYVLLGILCFFLCFNAGIRKKDNIPQNITMQTLFVTVLSVVWDYSTGFHGWSLDYVIPITCVVAMLAMATVAQVTRMPAGDYVFWLAINIVFGIAPLVFYLTGLVDQPIPSLVCMSASVISLAAVLLFEGAAIRQELVKRLHI